MAARRNTMRLRRHQKQEIRRPRPTVRNCSFLAVGGERHWFHLCHRTRTLPLPVGDQKRFLFCRNTTFFRGKRRSSGPGFRRNTTWRHEKLRLAGYGLEDAYAEQPDIGVIRRHGTVSDPIKYQPRGIRPTGPPRPRSAAGPKPEKLAMSTCFPLYPRKQTSGARIGMSELCHEEPSALTR